MFLICHCHLVIVSLTLCGGFNFHQFILINIAYFHTKMRDQCTRGFATLKPFNLTKTFVYCDRQLLLIFSAAHKYILESISYREFRQEQLLMSNTLLLMPIFAIDSRNSSSLFSGSAKHQRLYFKG